MNVKKVFRSLLVILTCCLSLSCVLDVLPENKTGSVSFTLPQTNVDARSVEARSAVYPEVYNVLMTSVDTKKQVYNRDHAAGTPVTIPDLEYGKYTIELSGESPEQYFNGSTEVTINKPKNDAVIDVHAFKRYGNIKLSIDATANKINEVVYTLKKDGNIIDNEQKIPLENYIGSVLIPNLYLGSSYEIDVMGSDGSYIYKGVSEQQTIVLKDNATFNLNYNNFKVISGNILLKGPENTPTAIENSVVSIIQNNTPIATRRIEKSLYDETSKGYILKNFYPGKYTLKIESANSNEVYTLEGTIELVAGQTVSTGVPSVSPRNIYYVGSNGDDNNKDAGIFDAPFRTLNKAIEVAKTNSQIVILDANLQNSPLEEIKIASDKTLEIKANTEQPALINANINLESNNPSITLTNVSVQNVTATSGILTLGNNSVVNGLVDISGTASLNLSNPKSIGKQSEKGGIKLADGRFVNILGNLPLDFSSTLFLTNYKTTAPIIKNDSTDIIKPKNIASFTLADSKYVINSKGLVVNKESSIVREKGQIQITNNDGSLESFKGSEVTVSDGIKFTQTKTLDSFPLIFDVDVGIYNITINTTDAIKIVLPDGDFYQVKVGDPTLVDLVAKNSVSISFTVPTADLVSPHFVLKHGSKEIENQALNVSDATSELTVSSQPYLISTGETLTAYIENENPTDSGIEKSIIFSKEYVVNAGDADVQIDMTQIRARYSIAPDLSDYGIYEGSEFKVSLNNKIYSSSFTSESTTPVSASIGYLEINKPLELTAMIRNLDNEYSYYSGTVTPNGSEENKTIKLTMSPNPDKVFLWGTTLINDYLEPVYKIDYSKNYVNENVLDTNAVEGIVTDFVLYPNNRVAVLNGDTNGAINITMYNEVGKSYKTIGLNDIITPADSTSDIIYTSITSNNENEFYVSYYESKTNTYPIRPTIGESKLAKITISSSQTQPIVQNLTLTNTPPMGPSGDGSNSNLYLLDNCFIVDPTTIYLSFYRTKDVSDTETDPQGVKNIEDGFIVYKGKISNDSVDLETILDSHTPAELLDRTFVSTDMYYKNGLLYVLAIDTTEGTKNTSLNEATFSSRGALITIDSTKTVSVKGLHSSLLTDSDEPTNKSNYILKENDELLKSSFLGPRKIVAIKEKELIIADAGAIYCPTKKNPSKYTPLDLEKRLIKVDLNGNILECENLLNKNLFDGSIAGHDGSGFAYCPF